MADSLQIDSFQYRQPNRSQRSDICSNRASSPEWPSGSCLGAPDYGRGLELRTLDSRQRGREHYPRPRVVPTDYPGLGTRGPHPYLVGPSEARAVLDSVRAARNMRRARAGDQFVLWGHSQGGQAVLFSAQMAPSYVPELKLAGIAAAAPAVELAELLKLDIAKTAGKVLGSQAFVAWSKVYPNADLHKLLPARSIPPAENIASRCITTKSDAMQDLAKVEGLKLIGFVNPDALSTAQPWATIIKKNMPGAMPIKAPMLIMQGSADPIVDPQTTAQYVKSLCAGRSRVEFQTLRGVKHMMAGFDSAPTVVLWVQDRFNRVKAPSNC